MSSPGLNSNVSMTMSPMALLPMCWCNTAALSRSVFPLRVCLAAPRAFSCSSSSDMPSTEDWQTESDSVYLDQIITSSQVTSANLWIEPMNDVDSSKSAFSLRVLSCHCWQESQEANLTQNSGFNITSKSTHQLSIGNPVEKETGRLIPDG